MYRIAEDVVKSTNPQIFGKFTSLVHKRENIGALDACLRLLVPLELGSEENLTDYFQGGLMKFTETIQIWRWLRFPFFPQRRNCICFTAEGRRGLK